MRSRGSMAYRTPAFRLGKRRFGCLVEHMLLLWRPVISEVAGIWILGQPCVPVFFIGLVLPACGRGGEEFWRCSFREERHKAKFAPMAVAATKGGISGRRI